MNNVNIEGISNINVVTNLFAQLNCLSNDNCFLVVVNRDYMASGVAPGNTLNRNATIVGAKTGGIAGGIVGGMVANSINNTVAQAVAEFNSKLNDKQKVIYGSYYCGYLLNITESGIGVIPLINDGQLLPKIKDFKTDLANFVYFSNDEIDKMELQKLPLHFSSKKLAIYFKNTGNVATPWQLHKKDKLISYQSANYDKIANRLK